jgi:hypothetical protein
MNNSGDLDGNWQPIEELRLDNADISVFVIMQNSVRYRSLVSDPLFNAAKQKNGWSPTEAFAAMACTEQWQFCNPTNKQCTDLSGNVPVTSQLDNLGFTSDQKQIADQILAANIVATIFSSLANIGSNVLLASAKAWNEVALDSLPDTQWQLEARNLFDIALARLQAYIVEQRSASYIANVSNSDDGEITNRYFCTNQKIRSLGSYQSFPFTPIAIIIGGGLLVILFGTFPESLLCCSCCKKRKAPLKEWMTDDKFQQQRIAMSESGYGNWTATGPGKIPITRSGDILAKPKRQAHGPLMVYRQGPAEWNSEELRPIPKNSKYPSMEPLIREFQSTTT